jgi:energy-coupling factor transporter ATP-binding protein EcfA2
MNLTKLRLRDFKQVSNVGLDLHSLNVIVGGNNSGKSSVLQGIHFFLTAAIASREAYRDTFTQEMLLFCPAYKFEELGRNSPYTNQTHKGYLTLSANLTDGTPADYEIVIYRGRNEGNVGCTRSGNSTLGATITDAEKLFSVYVPGLAGIPPFEQFRSMSVVRRGVASGDANLYLRNVILQIVLAKRLERLTKLVKNIFPGFDIDVRYNARKETVIGVRLRMVSASEFRALELTGTGVLQALQIFSYITLFEPQLLLLDEPDSHLHPDNQVLLAKSLAVVASDTSTQVILATHSRILVESLQDAANMIWLKAGVVSQQGMSLDHIPILLDIGALNDFDRLKAGKIEWLFLSEDTDMNPLKVLALRVGFDMKGSLFFSYRGISNFDTAVTVARFVHEISPKTKVVIHRDRDFMTDEEVTRAATRIEEVHAKLFVTEGSDIESYFTTPEHVTHLTSLSADDVNAWLDDIATQNHVQLQHSFTRKRDEVKRALYKSNPENCPDTISLLGNSIPLPRTSVSESSSFRNCTRQYQRRQVNQRTLSSLQ